jgi:hypothetical protein
VIVAQVLALLVSSGAIDPEVVRGWPLEDQRLFQYVHNAAIATIHPDAYGCKFALGETLNIIADDDLKDLMERNTPELDNEAGALPTKKKARIELDPVLDFDGGSPDFDGEGGMAEFDTKNGPPLTPATTPPPMLSPTRSPAKKAFAPAPDAPAPDAPAPDAPAPDAPAPDAPAPDAPAPDAPAPDALAPDALAPDALAPDRVGNAPTPTPAPQTPAPKRIVDPEFILAQDHNSFVNGWAGGLFEYVKDLWSRELLDRLKERLSLIQKDKPKPCA